MNVRTRLIRAWLLKMPRAHTVSIKSGDDVHSVEVGNTKWAAVAATVEALDPDVIEALDEKGKLLRAIKIDQLDDSGDGDEPATPEAKQEQKRLERESAMLTTFAQLLAEAYKHSTTVAFGKMVELFEAVSKRGESMEKSLAATERLLRKAYDEGASGGTDEEPSLLEALVSAFTAGKAQGGVEQAVASAVKSAPKANGKAQI